MPGVCASRCVLCIANVWASVPSCELYVHCKLGHRPRRAVCTSEKRACTTLNNHIRRPDSSKRARPRTGFTHGSPVSSIKRHEQTNPRRKSRRCTQFVVSSFGQIDVTHAKNKFFSSIEKRAFEETFLTFGSDSTNSVHGRVSGSETSRFEKHLSNANANFERVIFQGHEPMVHVPRLCLQEVFLPLEFLPIRVCAYRSCCSHKKVITGGMCSVLSFRLLRFLK